jgi:hypothetical protein
VTARVKRPRGRAPRLSPATRGEAPIRAFLCFAAVPPLLHALTGSQGIRLNPGLLVVLVVLGLANLALIVGALVSVVSRPTAGVRFGRKWIWVALIVLVNWIGPLAWFALGRIDVPLPHDPDTDGAPAAERAARAVELLYGPPEQR